MTKPLFVFGVARAGTNLIAGMLNAHPNVELALDPLLPFFKALRTALLIASGDRNLQAKFPSEAPFQDGYYDSQGYRLLDLVLTGRLDVPMGDENETLSAAIADRAALEAPEFARRLRDVNGQTFTDVLDQVFDRVSSARLSNVVWRGVKEVWTTEFIPLLARAYPEARFIIVRRDPRGIVASLLALAKKNPSQAAHTISYMRHWRKEGAVGAALMNDKFLDGRVMMLSYETVASDPEQGVKSLCAFLDLDLDRAMLYPIQGTGGAGDGNSSFGKIVGVSNISVERWRNVLSAAMIQTIEFFCGADMRLEGYALVGSLPTLLNEAITEIVRDADLSPGAWRSDFGTMEENLAHEETRWRLLSSEPKALHDGDEIRRHFLFESYFSSLRNAVFPNPQPAIS